MPPLRLSKFCPAVYRSLSRDIDSVWRRRPRRRPHRVEGPIAAGGRRRHTHHLDKLRAAMAHNTFNTLDTFDLASGKGQFYSLKKLEQAGVGDVSKLPVSIRIVLESVLRNVDGKKITENDVRTLASWQPNGERVDEIPFMVARVLLQDFTGVPLLVDLAAMRSAAGRLQKDAKIIEPLVPVDLVIDHSVQVDFFNSPDALQKNMAIEFKRNAQRYQFLKWGTK